MAGACAAEAAEGNRWPEAEPLEFDEDEKDDEPCEDASRRLR